MNDEITIQINNSRKISDERGEAEYQRCILIVESLLAYVLLPIADIIDVLAIHHDQGIIRNRLHIQFQNHPYYRKNRSDYKLVHKQ